MMTENMNLYLPLAASGYKSKSQIARIRTEEWATKNLYCPSCDSDNLAHTPPNTCAIDFACLGCSSVYELKSSQTWNENKVVDSAYDSMIAAVRSDQTPNLLVMYYVEDYIQNLLLVPSFFLTESAIEKRKPLALSARRAGWVGCNILLSQIPADGKIQMVSGGVAIQAEKVRAQFERIRPVAQIGTQLRGWTLDVLKAVRMLGQTEFSLTDIYRYEGELKLAHPDNQHIRDKIRQQLQILRDIGLIEFSGRGRYRLTDVR